MQGFPNVLLGSFRAHKCSVNGNSNRRQQMRNMQICPPVDDKWCLIVALQLAATSSNKQHKWVNGSRYNGLGDFDNNKCRQLFEWKSQDELQIYKRRKCVKETLKVCMCMCCLTWLHCTFVWRMELVYSLMHLCDWFHTDHMCIIYQIVLDVVYLQICFAVLLNSGILSIILKTKQC